MYCIPVESVPGRPRLRSASTGGVELPRVLTSTGQWSFSFHGPTVWTVEQAAVCSARRQSLTEHVHAAADDLSLWTVIAHHQAPL